MEVYIQGSKEETHELVQYLPGRVINLYNFRSSPDDNVLLIWC